MISGVKSEQSDRADYVTVWGLTPIELHDRFWASRGVQVVRPDEPSEIVEGAELFLLMRPRLLMIFRLRVLVEQLSWVDPKVMWIRLCDKRERGYREKAVTDGEGRLIRFERIYSSSDSRLARVALTSDPDVARLWQLAPDAKTGWRRLRAQIPSDLRIAESVSGRTYDCNAKSETMQFVRDLIETWNRPDATIDRVRKIEQGVWGDLEAKIDKGTNFIGSAWIGAGRELTAGTDVIGPAVLWDDSGARPVAEAVRWNEIEPGEALSRPVRLRKQSDFELQIKRLFDVLFGSFALLLVLPIFPLIMFLIWLEDGRPFFFAHRRETVGGREFPCLKFRSMRKDAEQVKAQLAKENKADGPQFFVPNDPRLTRIGAFIRKTYLDELPQLFNVIAGDMSIVGPRPSPHAENQYSPTWREARLSVRPGITGLWQVKRTRKKGLDFQEWIQFDIEYVENKSFFLDMWIVWKTIVLIFSRK